MHTLCSSVHFNSCLFPNTFTPHLHMTTLLEVLGLEGKEYSPFEIDQSYRNQSLLALRGLKSDHEPFYAVSDAYQVLRNPSHRKRYVELGDKLFFDQYHGLKYIDAVDMILDSFGVNKLEAYVPEIPALSIIMGCCSELKQVGSGATLNLSKHVLTTMRRPGWSDGQLKVQKQLGFTKGDYSRVKVIPQMRRLQELIDDYSSDKGAHVVNDKLIESFRPVTLGLDWMHVVGSALQTSGTNQYNKHRKLINNRSASEDPIRFIKDARKYVTRAQKFWQQKDLAYLDQVNMFYLACAFSLVMEVSKAVDKTIGHLFDAQKQQISKRKERAVPAKILADIGTWMVAREEVFITYDDVLASAITHTAYYIIYVTTRVEKNSLTDIPYKYPDARFPDRSKTLVKIGIDVRKAEDLSASESFQLLTDMTLVNAAIANQTTMNIGMYC